MEETVQTGPPEEKTMGGVSKFFNIFFEPKRVFQSLKIKPTWLVPVIIVAVLGMGFFYYTFPYIMNEQVQKIRDNDRIPEEQKERIIERITEAEHPPIWQMAIAPAGTLIALVIVAAVLFFVFNVLMGGDSGFRRVFSVYCYSSLIAVPAMIVKFPLVMMKGNINVQTSLGLLLSPDAKGSFLHSVLSSFDIFTIWQVILVSMGLGVIYKFSTQKAFTTVVILWIVWILAKSGLGSLFGGGGGLLGI
ncbi:MAG: YIP1 family protein [Candidatus Zixiibacteriota bacterium]|nr:MAG: YIP1 family protein [candidate division Zixibacteria bacterium]